MPVPAEWIQLIRPYLAELRAGRSPTSTIDTRRQHLECLARHINADPADVTEERLLRWCAEQSWAPESRRGRHTSFRQFWRWAASGGRLDNVAEKLPVVHQQRMIPRPTPDLVYLHALHQSSARTRLILRLAAEAGLCRAEIAQVHTERDLVQVAGGWLLAVRSAGGRKRYVPLPADVANELWALRPGWAFPGNDGGHLSPRWISVLAARALGGTWTLHSLRHRFESRAYEIDGELTDLERLIESSDRGMNDWYVEIQPDRHRKVAKLVSA